MNLSLKKFALLPLVLMLAATLALVATPNQANAAWNHEVTYTANGGVGDDWTDTVTYGKAIYAADNTFTREGYAFVNWNTAADGSGTSYEPGSLLGGSIRVKMTLYAQWESTTETGTCGTVTWTLDKTTGVLTVSGGTLDDNLEGWIGTDLRASVKSVLFEDTVTAGNSLCDTESNCGMFQGFTKLSNLDLSKLDTSQVNSMNYLFSGCASLTSLDLSPLDISRTNSMFSLFKGCTSLTTLTFDSDFRFATDEVDIPTPSKTSSGAISTGEWGKGSELADDTYSSVDLWLNGTQGGFLVGTWYAQTAPVTIAYEDGTSDTWDGTTSKEITKPATLTVNGDFTQTGQLYTKANVVINGNNHTITSTVTSTNPFVLGYNDTTTTTVNNLTINRTSGSSNNPLISVSGNVTFNSVNATDKAAGTAISLLDSKTVFTLNSSRLDTSEVSGYPTISKKRAGGTIVINGGTVKGSQQAIYMATSGGTLVINDGTITSTTAGSGGTAVVYANGANVYMNGGKVTSTASSKADIGIGVFGTLNFTGGFIENAKYGIYQASSSAAITVGDMAAFSSNTRDIYLAAAKPFTLLNEGASYNSDASTQKTAEKWAGNAVVGVPGNSLAYNTRFQVTQTGVDSSYTSQLKSYFTAFDTLYSGSGSTDGFIYFNAHQHSWTYAASDNTITATCSIDTDPCTYHTNPLQLTLSADNAEYTGSAYTGASVNDGISGVIKSGIAISDITYEGRGTTSYASSTTAPTDAGAYTAKVTLTSGDNSYEATVDFEITKPVVAEVTDGSGTTTTYESLEDALAAAKDGDTVTLKKDVTLDATADVNSSITLDLDGKTLTAPSGAAALNIADGKTVTVKSGTVSGSLTAGKNVKLSVDSASTGDITAGEGSTVATKNSATIGSVKASDSFADEVIDNGDGSYTVSKKKSDDGKGDGGNAGGGDSSDKGGTTTTTVTKTTTTTSNSATAQTGDASDFALVLFSALATLALVSGGLAFRRR